MALYALKEVKQSYLRAAANAKKRNKGESSEKWSKADEKNATKMIDKIIDKDKR